MLRTQRVAWFVLVWLVVAKCVVPDLVETFMRGGTTEASVNTLIELGRSSEAQAASLILDTSIVILAAFRVFDAFVGWLSHRRRGPMLPNFASGLYVAGLLIIVATSVLFRGELGRSILVLASASVALLIEAPVPREVARSATRIAMVVVGLSAVLAFATPTLAWQIGGTDGRFAIVSGVRLAGALVHPNMLGLWCGWLLIGVWSSWVRVLPRLVWSALALAVLVATGSRTAAIGTVLALVVLALRGRAREVFTFTGVGIAIAVALVPAFNPHALALLIGRTDIWAMASALWRQSAVFGRGLDFWQGRQISEGFPDFAFHAHNQFLDLLMTVGILGTAVFSVTLIAVWTSALRRSQISSPYSLAIMVTVAAQMVFEVPFQFSLLDSRQLGVLLLLLTLPRKTGADIEVRYSYAGPQRRALDRPDRDQHRLPGGSRVG